MSHNVLFVKQQVQFYDNVYTQLRFTIVSDDTMEINV